MKKCKHETSVFASMLSSPNSRDRQPLLMVTRKEGFPYISEMKVNVQN